MWQDEIKEDEEETLLPLDYHPFETEWYEQLNSSTKTTAI